MEPEEDRKKQLNDEVVAFMTKRSEHEAPRYTARLKTYVDIQQKRRRAAAARRHSEHNREKGVTRGSRKDGEQKDKSPENTDHQANDDDRMSRKRGGNEKCPHRSRSGSRSVSAAPSDACGRRRRRRSCRRKRRRRSCRRRRRRRSCRRKRRRRSCRRRRRRRSCSRRRRRRSCRRRRRGCRRRRRRC